MQSLTSTIIVLSLVGSASVRINKQVEGDSLDSAKNRVAEQVKYILTDGSCEAEYSERITDLEECKLAAQVLEKASVGTKFFSSSYWDRPCGCTWHRFGNVEIWNEPCSKSMKCTERGYGGCFCKKVLESSLPPPSLHPVPPVWPCLVDHDLVLTNVVSNNLGGLGPDTGAEHGIIYGNVFPNSIQTLNLKLSVKNTYEPDDLSSNGVRGGFGAVNIRSGTNADMVFSFTDETGAPVTPSHGFTFTIFDIDTDNGQKNIELFTIKRTEFLSYMPGSTVEVMEDGSVVTFSSVPEAGNEKNPSNPFNLREAQKARSVAFQFPAVDKFEFNFEVANAKDKKPENGRNIFFAGQSSFTCVGHDE